MTNPVELTLRSIILAILLTLLLAMSNCYLALKLGILTSASIPAAIISMGILRFFKQSTILENNMVQTAASAGEAVAGGIVYTIPALIIIHFWNGFDYWTNFLIAALGGILGVLFSIPLRRILVNEPLLNFPEGKAIAEVLKSSERSVGIKEIFLGGLVGSVLELFQMGFKVIASGWNTWFMFKRSLFGFGAGFSATMIGAGYLVGYEMAISIFMGAVIAWLGILPIVSLYFPDLFQQYPLEEAANQLWNTQMRYVGIGAMLFAGTWTFIQLMGPLAKSIRVSLTSFWQQDGGEKQFSRTDKDIPILYIFVGILIAAGVLFVFFQSIFPAATIGFTSAHTTLLVISAVLYVLIIGFLFSVITAYLSGMVGVTASPGSSVVIAGMLFSAWLLLSLINHVLPIPLSEDQLRAAEAITIIIGSVVTGIAAIANDNSQDLKVGQLVGATPWKQEVMLLIGVVISALIIPPVMQLLFDVYGIAGVMPVPGMDASQSLPAPTAAVMAAITEAVFRHTLPWVMIGVGIVVIGILLVLEKLLRISRVFHLSILGVAIGMYLPISSSFPLFLGGMAAYFVNRQLAKKGYAPEEKSTRKQRGVLIACGLVAGAALMDVVLAVPFSIFHSPDALMLVGADWHYGASLALVSTLGLLEWNRRRVMR